MLPLRFKERVVLISGGTDAIGHSIAMRFADERPVDRRRIALDPCGSGGAVRRGDTQAGDPPRTEVPYLFGATTQPFDWSWGGNGGGCYCAHCAIVNEQLPIDVYGHPTRVTEYPEQPGDKCCRVIYEEPANIPEQAYARVRRRTPGPS